MYNFKSMRRAILLILASLLIAPVAAGQVYNSAAGGWNTGYGTVYGSFGYANATQQLYQGVQNQIRRLENRQMMIRQFGLKAVEESERRAAKGEKSNSSNGNLVVPPPPPAPKFLGRFKPVENIDIASTVARALGDNKEEVDTYRQICVAMMDSLKKQAKAYGWTNDLAGAVTLFIATNSVLANNIEEPNEAELKRLYEAVRLSIDAEEDFAKLSNKEKHQLNDLLLAFAGIPLAFYADGTQRGDAQTLAASRQMSGKLIELVFKIAPEKMVFWGNKK